ncbi:hypothetical protein GCM10010116_42420 [Microbispora rosea subsp. aerata]|nr:hypothetical protein GCM10010116_42420 [Microbispora rosea subsp. aerata]GIH56138.1 hypothetical protein Mro02_30520 [Microbispora rosea subsp. aerata]GLJ85703.1 hypothetical protein GCM10017588_44360 [Microbispora rosea subsp. aerata]
MTRTERLLAGGDQVSVQRAAHGRCPANGEPVSSEPQWAPDKCRTCAEQVSVHRRPRRTASGPTSAEQVPSAYARRECLSNERGAARGRLVSALTEAVPGEVLS